MSWTLQEFNNNETLVKALTGRICNILIDAVARTHSASIALSGGNTPRALYQHLAMQILPWRQVTVSLVDERWVSEDHPDSNARMIQETLLQHHAESACFIGMKLPEAEAIAAEKVLDLLLKDHILPLDLVLLGMGSDGHTASFFPNADGLSKALALDNEALCCALQPFGAPYARMSLTLSTLMKASHRILYITGISKREVLEQAFQPGDIHELPVRAVLHHSQILTEIYYAPDD
jgi:6-phosphogluconolactonase